MNYLTYVIVYAIKISIAIFIHPCSSDQIVNLKICGKKIKK